MMRTNCQNLVRAACVVLLCLGPTRIVLASGSVVGKVVDRSGQPVDDAEKVTVTISPFEDKSLRTYTTKVKKGAFFFGTIDPGEYQIDLTGEKVALDAVKLISQDAKHKEVNRWEGKVVKGMQPVRIGVKHGEQGYFEVTLTVAPLEDIQKDYAQTLLGKVSKALQSGDIALTEKMVGDFLKESPGDPVGLTVRAYVHQQLGRTAEAEADLTQALKTKPNFGDALYQLADLYSRTDRAEPALETLRKIDASDADSKHKAQAAVLCAQIQHSRGKLDEEAACLEKAQSLSPEIAEAVLPQLIAVDLDLGKTAAAENLMKQATASGKVDASLEYNLAATLFNRKAYDQAAKYFEAAYRDDPKLTDSLRNLGLCYMQLGDTAKALEKLKAFLATNPKAELADETRALIEALEGKNKNGDAKGGHP